MLSEALEWLALHNGPLMCCRDTGGGGRQKFPIFILTHPPTAPWPDLSSKYPLDLGSLSKAAGWVWCKAPWFLDSTHSFFTCICFPVCVFTIVTRGRLRHLPDAGLQSFGLLISSGREQNTRRWPTSGLIEKSPTRKMSQGDLNKQKCHASCNLQKGQHGFTFS